MNKTFRLQGMERCPWWARMWRYDPVTDSRYILPIPFCWAMRLAWNIWCWSYKIRLNQFETRLLEAYRAGYQDEWGEEATKELYVEET